MSMDTPLEIVLRLIAPEDAAELQANCMPMATVEGIRRWIPEDLRAYEAGEKLPLVAVVDGAVVGTATLVRKTYPLERHVAEVRGVVVAARYQRRGIARRLIEELRVRAAAMELEILEISCRSGTAAEAVYRRLGFVEYGRLPRGLKESSGKVFDHVFFTMPLPAASRGRRERPLPGGTL